MDITNFRTDSPQINEFEGNFPKKIIILAYVGIRLDSGEWFDKHFCLGLFFHIAKKYEIGFDVGVNEHGVKYEIISWTKLPSYDKMDRFMEENKCRQNLLVQSVELKSL